MEVPKSLMTKKIREDKQISAGLIQAHLCLQAKCRQTSDTKWIKVFFFAI